MENQRSHGTDDEPNWPRSLFVLSLPRSLSTVIYHAAHLSLGFAQPGWSSDGEFLNLDRFALTPGESREPGSKYTLRQTCPELFDELLRFLDRSVAPSGVAYKDVVHPFVTSVWLAGKRYAILKIHRDVADVAMSMWAREWYYPAKAATEGSTLEEALVEGLLRAWDAIDSLPGSTLEYSAAIRDECVLNDALAQLYPDLALRQVRFINDTFRSETARLMKRRGTPQYHRFAEIVAQISQQLPASTSEASNEGGVPRTITV